MIVQCSDSLFAVVSSRSFANCFLRLPRCDFLLTGRCPLSKLVAGPTAPACPRKNVLHCSSEFAVKKGLAAAADRRVGPEASAALGSSPSTEPRLGLEPLADPWLLPAQTTLPSHR